MEDMTVDRNFYTIQNSPKTISRDFLLDIKSVIPAKVGIQSLKNTCKAGQLPVFVRYAGCFSCWIPSSRDNQTLASLLA
jgi:hypothetical protein